jgi:hypothetical protein
MLARRYENRRASTRSPSLTLENDSVTLEVFEGPTASLPKWIRRRHRDETSAHHGIASHTPFVVVFYVEDQEMIVRRCAAKGTTALRRELEMIRLVVASENDAVDAVMVRELGENGETKPSLIHLGNGTELIRWTRNS